MNKTWIRPPIYVEDNACIGVCNGCVIIGSSEKVGKILEVMGSAEKSSEVKRKAHWVVSFDKYYCSSCGFIDGLTTALPDVCPSCGSRME